MNKMVEQFSSLSYNITKKISTIDKKNGGIFFTPYNIIHLAFQLVVEHIGKANIKNILEPSCGTCEIVRYLDSNMNNINIDCIELNDIIYNSIKDIIFINNVNIIKSDFLIYETDKKYDLIIGNPPYFVMKKSDIDNKFHKYITGRPNIYVLFIIKCLQLLNTGGILCFVLPKNFLNCLYYNKLREYINTNFSIVSIIECYGEKYIETQQDTILFVIQNNKPTHINNYCLKISDSIIFNTIDNIINIREILNNSTNLHKLNFRVKVGNVVWNNNKSILTDNKNDTRLIYSGDIINNKLSITNYKNTSKKNYIKKSGKSELMLIINRGYGNGEYKFKYCIIDIDSEYLIENHLICIEYTKDIEKNKLLILYNKIISSFKDDRTNKFIKLYFNNNAINTYELEYILPIFI